jgi:hypothetical protein
MRLGHGREPAHTDRCQATPLRGIDMERQYYIEKDHETAETSDCLEAKRIAAEWTKRGYKVETVVVDVTDQSVQLADDKDISPSDSRAEVPVSRCR